MDLVDVSVGRITRVANYHKVDFSEKTVTLFSQDSKNVPSNLETAHHRKRVSKEVKHGISK